MFALSTLTLSTSSPYFHTKPVQIPLKQDETEQTLHFNIVTHGVNHSRREINRGELYSAGVCGDARAASVLARAIHMDLSGFYRILS